MVHDRLAERALLRESAERFVAGSYGIDARNAIASSAPGYSTTHWETFAELGWLAMRIPEACGGIGASFADAALMLEAFGNGLLLEPMTSCAILSTALLADAAAAPAVQATLDGIGAGTTIVATAYREPGDGCDPHAVTTRVTAGDGGGFTLTGTKIGVPFGGSAGRFIVSARDDVGALHLVLADASAPGVTIDEHRAVDGTRTARVALEHTPVMHDALLPLLNAERTLAYGVDQADAALCAEAVGVMARAFADTAEYVRERIQFGRAIAAFQVVRHRIVDMFVELELARAAAALAADAIDANDAGDDTGARAIAVSMAKIQVIRSGRFICEGAVQLHGAIGIAAEAAPAHAFARMNGIAATFGDLLFHRNRYLRLRERSAA